MTPTTLQWIAAALFGIALLHTFTVKHFERLSHRFPRHAGLFHLLGEVEVVFGFWAMVLILAMALVDGGGQALQYAESRNYTEPLFVFVVMVIAASRPVLRTVVALVDITARLMPLPTPMATAWLGLAAVPLLGSLITEPAAMTIAALMLAPQIFRADVPEGACRGRCARKGLKGAQRLPKQALWGKVRHLCGPFGIQMAVQWS